MQRQEVRELHDQGVAIFKRILKVKNRMQRRALKRHL